MKNKQLHLCSMSRKEMANILGTYLSLDIKKWLGTLIKNSITHVETLDKKNKNKF